MITKIYKTLWLIGILFAAGIYFAGLMTEMVQVVFGFLSFGMVFMGMISVLPFTISHPIEEETFKTATESASVPSVSHAHTA